MNAHYEVAPRKPGVKVNPLSGVMRWRCIGPFRGGRVVAVAGHPTETATFYFGAVAGGVWKTTDAGVYWRNVSDRYFTTSSVGAIAVSESDPNVIYVGTGESCIRNNVTHGDGVYRSTDGGETWRNMGLRDTRHIARVRVHPKDPDIVYVAALGHAFGPNDERGVFRSTDGGETWERVLFVSDGAGAVDLSMDPNNPRTMYASIWQVHRSFWDIVSGGPECGLYKTTDGGDTWVDLSDRPGLPKETLGRIGVALSPARPGRVWALIEAENGGLFRSDDGGGHLGAPLGRRRPADAVLVLHPHLRGPVRLRNRLGARGQDAEIDERGAALHRGADASRRPARPVDRPARQPQDDRGQRRGRDGVAERR